MIVWIAAAWGVAKAIWRYLDRLTQWRRPWTIADMVAAAKEVWNSVTIEEQLYSEPPWCAMAVHQQALNEQTALILRAKNDPELRARLEADRRRRAAERQRRERRLRWVRLVTLDPPSFGARRR